MKLAAELNGLDSNKLAPWHLKSTFQFYDPGGKPSEQGTYEEFWASTHKYKRVYTTPSSTQTEWATEDAKYYFDYTGSDDIPKIFLALIRLQTVSPLPPVAEIAKVDLKERIESVGNVRLVCVSLTQEILGGAPSITHPVFTEGTYCFGEEKPILRISINGGIRSAANTLALFQDRYVAKSVTITGYGKPLLDIKLESLRGLQSVQPSDFDPPAEVLKKPLQLIDKISSGAAQEHILRKIPPVYPAEAKRLGIQGIVVLEARVGKDGHVQKLMPILSPDSTLTQAALNAVKQWQYRPFLIDGQPVEIKTEINVIFNMNF
jgi:TonB family protein